MAWLTGWQYRESHEINSANNAGTNYQVRIVAHYGSGTNYNDNSKTPPEGHVFCNGKCRTDFGDIHFTDDDGVTELAYWMESKVDGDYAIFWVKVNDDLSMNPATIYIYYGNPNAATASNLTATFNRVINSTILALPMDEGSGTTVYDQSGNGNNGMIYGASWVDGKYGKALSFDGVDDYAKVEPFTVYGWPEITIAEWVYAFRPKANTAWSKFSMIGDFWTDYPSTLHSINNLTDYTVLNAVWCTRKPDGTKGAYSYSWISYVNQWVHIVRRFTVDREFSVWINGVKVYSATVPATEKTVLEWNPDTATRPERYKRFVLGANSQLNEWMKCMCDEVRIYNRALTADEISDLYSGYPFEVLGNSEATGKTLVRKYVSPEPAHGIQWRKIRGYFIEDYERWKKKRLLRLLRQYILLGSEDE